MTNLDNDLKAAFALLDLANFKWLTDDEWSKLHSPPQKGLYENPA